LVSQIGGNTAIVGGCGVWKADTQLYRGASCMPEAFSALM